MVAHAQIWLWVADSVDGDLVCCCNDSEAYTLIILRLTRHSHYDHLELHHQRFNFRHSSLKPFAVVGDTCSEVGAVVICQEVKPRVHSSCKGTTFILASNSDNRFLC